MPRRKIAFAVLCALLLFLPSIVGADALAALGEASEDASSTFRLAVLSDLHIGKDNEDMVGKVVEAINRDETISAVAILGDLSEKTASPDELKRAAEIVRRIQAPTIVISGNHDCRYLDRLDSEGKKRRGTPEEQASKLEGFRQAFAIPDLRHSKIDRAYATVGEVQGLSVPTVYEEETWIRILDLAPGRLRLRSFDVAEGRFVEKLDRVIAP